MYKPETSYEEFLKKELEKYPELNLKDIDELTERVKSNSDLPPVSAKLIVMFLHSSYFDVDKAYKTIESHCKYRKELPQLFDNYDPTEKGMKKAFENITICQLLESQEGKEMRYIFTNFKNTDPQMFDCLQSLRFFFMMTSHLAVTTGTCDGIVMLMNAKGMGWRHITKSPIHLLKKTLGYVQEGLPVRLKAVHVINAGSIITMLFNIIRPFMGNSLMDLVQIHTEGSTEYFDHVDAEIIPSEVGGKGKSHYELSEKTYEQMVAARDWYLSASY